jgi:acyl-CoA thioester hydrolase
VNLDPAQFRWFEKDIEIRYADTDQMGVVHHAVHPVYCELGRTQLIADAGLPYHRIEAESGIYLMVVDMTCRYRAPARYGEAIFVKTAISRLKTKLMTFNYEIRKRDNQSLLFTGTTTHLFSQGTGSTIKLPDSYMKLFKQAAGIN